MPTAPPRTEPLSAGHYVAVKRTILLIVVVCALAARWAHHVHDEKIMELEAALQLLWGLPDQRVEIRGSAIIVDANMPATPTPPPARWNYDYLRFVSRLRGFGELGEISVNGHREIGSLTPSLPLGSARRDPSGFLLQRQLQIWLDQTIGSGHGLALVGPHEEIEHPVHIVLDGRWPAVQSQKAKIEELGTVLHFPQRTLILP